jgi:hypothetical protein
MKKFILTTCFLAITSVAFGGAESVKDWCAENEPDNPDCFIEQAVSAFKIQGWIGNGKDQIKGVKLYICHTLHEGHWSAIWECIQDLEN